MVRDSRLRQEPVREVTPFTSPPPEARSLSYDVVCRILGAMSDQGSAMVKGKPRAATSAPKVRCRVLAFTGLRPSELMRYRPEHWNRTVQTLVRLHREGRAHADDSASVRARRRLSPISKPSGRSVRSPPPPSDVAFIRAAARIGIHGVRPYDLRHSYGTVLYGVAGDTRLVKDVLGHSRHPG